MVLAHRRLTTTVEDHLPAFHGGGMSFTEGVAMRSPPRRQHTVSSSNPSTLEQTKLPDRRRSSSFLNGSTTNYRRSSSAPRPVRQRLATAGGSDTNNRRALLIALCIATLLPWAILIGTRTRLTKQIQVTTQHYINEQDSLQSELDLQLRLSHEHSSKIHNLEDSNSKLLKKLHELTRESSSDVQKRVTDHENYDKLEVEEEHILHRIDVNHMHIKLSGRDRLRQTYGYEMLPHVSFHLLVDEEEEKRLSFLVELAPIDSNPHAIDRVLRWVIEDRIWDNAQLSEPRSARHQQQLQTTGLKVPTTRELAFLEHHQGYGRAKGRLCLVGKGPNFVVYLNDPTPEEEVKTNESCFGQVIEGLEHLKGQANVKLDRVKVVKRYGVKGSTQYS